MSKYEYSKIAIPIKSVGRIYKEKVVYLDRRIKGIEIGLFIQQLLDD